MDAGKSTLMGRILHLLGRVTQKEMHKNEKESKQQVSAWNVLTQITPGRCISVIVTYIKVDVLFIK